MSTTNSVMGSSNPHIPISCPSGVNWLVMDALPIGLKYSELTDKIIGAFYDVYNELGYGFLESTYSEAMVIALEQLGYRAVREVPVPVWFRGWKVGQYFADMV